MDSERERDYSRNTRRKHRDAEKIARGCAPPSTLDDIHEVHVRWVLRAAARNAAWERKHKKKQSELAALRTEIEETGASPAEVQRQLGLLEGMPGPPSADSSSTASGSGGGGMGFLGMGIPSPPAPAPSRPGPGHRGDRPPYHPIVLPEAVFPLDSLKVSVVGDQEIDLAGIDGRKERQTLRLYCQDRPPPYIEQKLHELAVLRRNRTIEKMAKQAEAAAKAKASTASTTGGQGDGGGAAAASASAPQSGSAASGAGKDPAADQKTGDNGSNDSGFGPPHSSSLEVDPLPPPPTITPAQEVSKLWRRHIRDAQLTLAEKKSVQKSLSRLHHSIVVIPRNMLAKTRRIGRGGCGFVYEGKYAKSTVAIKEILSNLADEMDLDEFVSEVNVMASLPFPQIARLLGICQERRSSRMMIVMEHYPMSLFKLVHEGRHGGAAAGGIASLRSRLASKDGPASLVLDSRGRAAAGTSASAAAVALPSQTSSSSAASIRSRVSQGELYSAARLRRVFLDVAKGLLFTHTHGYVHRDIKPANVLINRSFGGVLSDFGLSNAFVDGDKDEGGYSTGTMFYMAPEQHRGSVSTEFATAVDTYAFGVMLWEAIARVLPFTEILSLTDREISDRVMQGYRPIVCENMPPVLVGLLTRCWAPRASNRPRMADIVELLETHGDQVIPDDVQLLQIQQVLAAKIQAVRSELQGGEGEEFPGQSTLALYESRAQQISRRFNICKTSQVLDGCLTPSVDRHTRMARRRDKLVLAISSPMCHWSLMRVDTVIGSDWSPTGIAYFRTGDKLGEMLALLSDKHVVSCPVYSERERIVGPEEEDPLSDLDDEREAGDGESDCSLSASDASGVESDSGARVAGA